jgi:hypothetical protein
MLERFAPPRTPSAIVVAHEHHYNVVARVRSLASRAVSAKIAKLADYKIIRCRQLTVFKKNT